ncbi:unnamed protein product [Schistosoma haematobium]|nr:unnamed protein product [Schistosoma haematobium]
MLTNYYKYKVIPPNLTILTVIKHLSLQALIPLKRSSRMITGINCFYPVYSEMITSTISHKLTIYNVKGIIIHLSKLFHFINKATMTLHELHNENINSFYKL